MGKRIACKLSRHYGVDVTGMERSRHFASLSRMMHRPREKDGALSRAVGYRRICTLPYRIHDMISADGGASLLIHAGECLYLLRTDTLPELPSVSKAIASRNNETPATVIRLKGVDESGKSTYLSSYLPDRPLPHAALGSAIYFLCDTHLLRYDGGRIAVIADETNPMTVSGVTVTDCISPYVPLVLSDGSACEQRNLLTDLCRVTASLDSGVSNDRSGPFTYERTDNGDDGVPTCRVLSYTGESPLSFLAVPETAVVDGVHCAVTDIAPEAFEGSDVRALSIPASMKALATTSPLLGIENLRSLYLPYGVTMLTRQSLLYAPDHLRIYYAGTAIEWEEVSLVPGDGTYTPTVIKNAICPYRALTVDLPHDAKILECLSLTLNGEEHTSSGLNVAYQFLSDGDGGYRALYLLVSTLIPLSGMQIGMLLRCAPYAYKNGDSGAAHPLLRDGEESKGARALAMSATLLTAYDQRLFLGAPSAAKDAFFYTQTDSSGRGAPHYLACENYDTDLTGGELSGIYEAEGDLLLLRHRRDERQSTLSACEGVTPEAGAALFRRVYPVVREASLPLIRYAFVFGGKLHLLTENGLFRVTRETSGGHFSMRHVSSRVDPLLLSPSERNLHATLEGLLLLSHGGSMLIGDLLRAEDDEYEWYPIGESSAIQGDRLLFRSMTELPFGDEYGFVLPPSGGIAPLEVDTAGRTATDSEVHFLQPCTAQGAPLPASTYIPCVEGSGCYLPMSSDGIFTDGTESPFSALCTAGELTFLASEGGGVFLYNTDTSTADERTYLCDCHESTAYVETFPFDAGVLQSKKRTVPKTAYLAVGKDSSNLRISVAKDGGAFGSVQKTGACCFDFERLDFSSLAFEHLHVRPVPLLESVRDYYEKSYKIESASRLSFREIGFTAELRERGKIL